MIWCCSAGCLVYVCLVSGVFVLLAALVVWVFVIGLLICLGLVVGMLCGCAWFWVAGVVAFISGLRLVVWG